MDGPLRYRDVPESGYHDAGWMHVFARVAGEMDRLDEVFEWCDAHCPRQPGETWRWQSHSHGRVFTFLIDDDAFAFKMRWC